jgi:glutathione synthase/RimK-type ligase-like ATP-grasp enzyme
MADVALVTSREMSPFDIETPMLAAALAELGIGATIAGWGTPESAAGRLVVIRTAWDYVAEFGAFMEWARSVAAATRLVNSLEVVTWNSHKSYLLDLAYAAVPIVPTVLVPRGTTDDDLASLLEEHEGEIVIKPAISAAAVGAVRTVADTSEALRHLEQLVSVGDALVQPYVASVVGGETSLIYLGGELSHAVRKQPAPGDYRVQEMYGGTRAHHDATDAEREVGAAAVVAAPGRLAYARVDLVDTPNGPAVMELEAIEPQLFLDAEPQSPGRFAAVIAALLSESV